MKRRRHFADQEKVAILKRHLVDRVPVSDLCDEHDLYANQFYDWLKKFFENGHLAFANGRKSKAVEDAHVKKIEQLEAKLTRKNEVMAELMEAHTELKKATIRKWARFLVIRDSAAPSPPAGRGVFSWNGPFA